MVAFNFADAARRIEVPRAAILLSSALDRAEGIVAGSIDLAANEALILEFA
jgi:hypothetical protein